MRNRPSSTSVKKANIEHSRLLLEALEEGGKDDIVDQDFVIKLLGLDESKKKSITKLVSGVFPNAGIERDRSGGKLKKLYRGLRKKISFIVIAPDANVEEPNIELVDIPEITKVKSKISELTDELDSINKILEEELSKEEISKDNVTLLFTKQRHTTNSIEEFRNSLEHFYDFELK